MNNILSTKILLRKDTISNWESVNPVLMDGETIIVVESDGNIRLKIGDGIKKYKQLPFIHENAVETKSISQGLYSTARPYGIAGGFKVSADSQFAQAFGINATTSGDNYSFVWNGDNDLTENAYASHGTGTFNINPSDGLSGFYIGEHNLQEIIKNEAPEPNLSDYYTKIQVEELHNKLSGYLLSNDVEITMKHEDQDPKQIKHLSVLKVSGEDYDKLIIDEEILSDAIYVVNRDYVETYGERIVNVADPIELSDATNKKYVDSKFSQVEVPTKVSQLQNDIGYLSTHQSLSDYYTKEDVDEISSNLANKSIVRLSIPESRVQQDLSVLNIVKVSKSKYQQMESASSILSDHLYIVEDDDDGIIFGGNSFTC